MYHQNYIIRKGSGIMGCVETRRDEREKNGVELEWKKLDIWRRDGLGPRD